MTRALHRGEDPSDQESLGYEPQEGPPKCPGSRNPYEWGDPVGVGCGRDQDEAGELCRYRLMLENAALELSHSLDRDGLMASLESIFDEMTGAHTADDFDLYLDLDTRFHDAFFEFCGN